MRQRSLAALLPVMTRSRAAGTSTVQGVVSTSSLSDRLGAGEVRRGGVRVSPRGACWVVRT